MVRGLRIIGTQQKPRNNVQGWTMPNPSEFSQKFNLQLDPFCEGC